MEEWAIFFEYGYWKVYQRFGNIVSLQGTYSSLEEAIGFVSSYTGAVVGFRLITKPIS